MSKVFMITEGLENMGALKTGGQGSVYKGRRVGEIITAVKILPTPISIESEEDKNYLDFKNEVEKLKRVNEAPNPNVVKILNSGITESGSFPFIEMEFVEGPDLEELLKPPHDPIYSVKGAIKVAEQLANALAHCHKVEVKHGDIKSNNVKYNIHTANYVLLDFGMAVMSDEQRRTSLRHAGAIEFMAPEQNEGLMLYQTDIYSFGIVLFEILSGSVPFPVNEKSETARHNVMVAHMETPVPDLMRLRSNRLPQHWDANRKKKEMQLPHWLTDMIYKCLEKKPEDRFENGMQLLEYIHLNNTLTAKKEERNADYIRMLEEENERLLQERSDLQSNLLQTEKQLELKNRQLAELQTELQHRSDELIGWEEKGMATETSHRKRGIPKSYFLWFLLFAIGLAAVAGYSFFKNDSRQQVNNDTTANTDSAALLNQSDERFAESDEEPVVENKPTTSQPVGSTSGNDAKPKPVERQIKDAQQSKTTQQEPEVSKQTSTVVEEPNNNTGLGKYQLAGRRIYFHNEPDESTKRNAFIVHWNNATLTALDEKNGFVYVVYKNHLGQTSKGWLPKKELKAVD